RSRPGSHAGRATVFGVQSGLAGQEGLSVPTLHVVHCVDTEGPLYESLEATFERLHTMTGVRLSPSRATLAALRRGEVDLGGKEDTVRLALSEQLLAYNDTWDKVDAMLDDMMSDEFRSRFGDP